MPDHRFAVLRQELIENGVSPRRLRRLLGELQDHCADIEADEMARGLTRAEARAEAARRIGGQHALVSHYTQRPELRSWVQRQMPALAVFHRRCITGLPGCHEDEAATASVLKWGAAASVSAAATLILILLLQVVITTS